ncbi:MAG: hypothetical protein HGN29_00290 [Asgard group archaeon]|nr:hypothetical protein [Asgard group archaeon]
MSEMQQEKKASFSSSGRIKEKETKIKVMGSVRIAGGKIEKFVKSSGSAKIEGNLECHGFKSRGSTRGNGAIISQGSVKNSGSFSIAGSLQGTENARFFGSASIGEKIDLKGKLKAFGSIKSGNSIETGSNIMIFGSASTGGDILTESDVKVKGSVSVSGNIFANNVTLGKKRGWNIFAIKQGSNRPYKISGSIISKNRVNLRGTIVKNDVKGRDVHIRKYSDVQGQIYYQDSIKVHRKAKTNREPIKLNE